MLCEDDLLKINIGKIKLTVTSKEANENIQVGQWLCGYYG